MKIFAFVIAMITLFSACKKDGNSSKEDTITYEATLSFGSFASIVYLDENGNQQVGIPATNSWKITFTNKIGRPRRLEFIVSPYYDLIDPNAVIPDTHAIISVNGSEVKNDIYNATDNVDFRYDLY